MSNEPAFPVPGLQHDETFNGMTLRDYFAAKAMQGLITTLPEKEEFNRRSAEWCYHVADMMLAVRKQ